MDFTDRRFDGAIARGRQAQIILDGRAVHAFEGESIAAAVLATGRRALRRTALRPGSPDELPILGPVTGLRGYLNACGHFRTGILNAPLTGLVIAESAASEPPSYPIEPFLLCRLERKGRGQVDEQRPAGAGVESP